MIFFLKQNSLGISTVVEHTVWQPVVLEGGKGQMGNEQELLVFLLLENTVTGPKHVGDQVAEDRWEKFRGSLKN